jgi:uncharacterized repeat protein (TIGR01451 family)
MSKARLIIAFLPLLPFAFARPASAASFEVSYNDDCCHETVVDCNDAPGGPGCSAGHRGDDSTFHTSFCPLHSCVSLGEDCRSDHGPSSYLSSHVSFNEVPLNGVDDDCDGSVDECTPGEMLACTTKLRSCAAAIGTETCAANGFPDNMCVATGAADPDSCPKAACVGGVIDNTDTDQDGLLDCWEHDGIDYDGDGVVDFVLPGANPNHKDIYVESDYFDCTVGGGDCPAGDTHQHGPVADAITRINQTYQNAPVTNPDGVTGITMHLQVDEALPHVAFCEYDASCFGPTKSARFGTAAERANPKARLAKRLVYRYVLWAHALPNIKNSGKSGSPASDSILTLAYATNKVGSSLEQAGTFLHEVGHELGLGHGGGDSINGKPNYLSVMNYTFQMTGIPQVGGLLSSGVFDYSRVELPKLNELNLSEPAGIGDPGMNMTFFRCPGFGPDYTPGNGPINWDCIIPPDPTALGLKGDINGDRICIQSGADTIRDSMPGGDDEVAGGYLAAPIGQGLHSPISPNDEYGFDDVDGHMWIIKPGQDGKIDTPAVLPDRNYREVIWDGANRTCETVIAATDVGDDNNGAPRMMGSVQPAELTGFDDWGHLLYDFSPTLHGFDVSGAAATVVPVEPDMTKLQELSRQAQIADLTLTQSLSRSADGSNVTIQLTVVNHGPSAALSATITDQLPLGVSYRSCAATAGGVCATFPMEGGNTAVAVNFASLASGQTATVTVTGCSAATGTLTNAASINAATTDPNRSDNAVVGTIVAPRSLPAQQLANGDMRYAITFPAVQAYVEAFVRQNGVQNVSGNIVGSRVNNADGTFTYSRVVPASQYHAGDVLQVRFYSYRSGQPAVYTPGPLENLWSPDFVYGTGSATCSTSCRPTYAQLANGDVKVTHTYSTPQAYAEAFVRDGATQVASGSLPGTANFDGTFTYARTVPAASFHAGDQVTFRFYSYVTGGPQVFNPGPAATTYYPGFRYGVAPTSDCP